MRKINKELLKQLRDGEIAIQYNAKGKSGDLDGLRLVLNTAFPDDISSEGTSDFYIASRSSTRWVGRVRSDLHNEYKIVDLIEFFIMPKLGEQYEIY